MRNLTVWRVRTLLARRLPRLADHGERGAVGVLVTVLLGGGVLLGMGALVVDVGQLYQNRAELQNGADAAALAVAKSCAEGSCKPDIATTYADDNASKLTGHKAKVDLVCGSGTLGSCPPSTGGSTDCPAAPPAGTSYVDVHTSTELADNSHLLPPVFARTLVGNGSYQGSTVHACAQAEWGAAKSQTTVGFTISACSWDVYTQQGGHLASPPPYPPDPDPSLDQVIYEHGVNPQTTCPSQYGEPSGSEGPGAFGWTDDSGNCSVFISGGSYGGSTGASVSSDCQTALYNAWSTQTEVYLPVYTTIDGSGTNVTYTLKGFAAFVITGYYFPGSATQGYKEKDWVTGQYPCGGSDFCMSGFFTHALVPSVGSLGGPDLGSDIVKLTG